MKAQGTVKGILFEASDGAEYLLGFSTAPPGRRRSSAAGRPMAPSSAVEDLREASKVARRELGISGPHLIGPGMGKEPVPLDRVQGGAEDVPARPDLADLVSVKEPPTRSPMKKDAVRAEVQNLVHGPSYMTFDDVVADFPMKHINTRPPNVSYTPGT